MGVSFVFYRLLCCAILKTTLIGAGLRELSPAPRHFTEPPAAAVAAVAAAQPSEFEDVEGADVEGAATDHTCHACRNPVCLHPSTLVCSPQSGPGQRLPRARSLCSARKAKAAVGRCAPVCSSDPRPTERRKRGRLGQLGHWK